MVQLHVLRISGKPISKFCDTIMLQLTSVSNYAIFSNKVTTLDFKKTAGKGILNCAENH